MTHLRDAIAISIATAMAYLLWSDSAIAHPVAGYGALAILYVASCVGLIWVLRSGHPLHVLSKIAGCAAGAILAFTAWAHTLGAVPLDLAGRTAPAWLKFAGLFIPMATAACVTSILLLFPMSLLLGRYAWISSVLGCLLAFAATGDVQLMLSRPTIGASIMAFEWVVFLTLPAALLSYISPRVKRIAHVA